MTKTPEPAAPSAGGAYVADKDGNLRRDGHTPQTKDGDLALPKETPKALQVAVEKEAEK